MSEGVTKQPGEMMQACMGMMEGMREEADKGVCPMATMCKGMMEKTGFGWLLLIPGAALILGGILILIDPNILFWLLAWAINIWLARLKPESRTAANAINIVSPVLFGAALPGARCCRASCARPPRPPHRRRW